MEMFEKFCFSKIHLQMFAEGEETPEETPETHEEEKEPAERPNPEAKYTDADLDRIIGQKFAAWQKQQEKKVSEAERLSKMTAEEKAAERVKALEDKLHSYEVAAAKADMMKQGRAMLHDKNIVVGDELLSNLIAEDAESTKASVESFISMFNAAVEKAVKEALKGEAPKAGSAASGLTKEQILAVKNRAERQRLMAEHPELF